MEKVNLNTVEINGVKYVRADSISVPETPKGNRHVVIVDRGWIFAGDLTEENGRIRLDRAVWVFRWESVGFSVILADPSKADIRNMSVPVNLPVGAEIFRCPVSDSWGL